MHLCQKCLTKQSTLHASYNFMSLLSNSAYQCPLPQGHFALFTSKPNFAICEVEQVHGNVIVQVNTSNSGPADGMIALHESSDKANLAIKTADCLPIVVLGKLGHGMIHAGHRGIKQKIHTNALLNQIWPYFVFIGPHIQRESFIVGEDFRDIFPNSPHLHRDTHNTLTFDLYSQVKDDMLKAWPDITVNNCGIDTLQQNNLHSYRRDKTEMRNYNVYLPDKI